LLPNVEPESALPSPAAEPKGVEDGDHAGGESGNGKAGETDIGDDRDMEVEGGEEAAGDGSSGTAHTWRYPPAVPDFTILSDREQRFRVARFLECTVTGCDCSGLVPPEGSIGLGRANEDVQGMEIDGESGKTEEGWWTTCGSCGHGWDGEGHVWGNKVGAVERKRRSKVVGRIEEILQVSFLASKPFSDGGQGRKADQIRTKGNFYNSPRLARNRSAPC
jgi:histone acetyltransferase